MGAKSSSIGDKEFYCLLDQYEIIQECPEEGLKYLQSRSTQQEYLLRQINCQDGEVFKTTEELLNQRQKQLEDNKHIANLKRIITSQQDQYCMTFYKIYTLWEFPQRTLEDEINQRVLQKRKFQEKELWSILASCILGLSHLQKEDIKHNCLKSGTILIDPEGIVRLYDPLATGTLPNYEKLLSNRGQPHLYLSPEQTQSLREQRNHPNCDPFKTDIWTLGMILLEAGLLSYQDECYREQCSRIHWDTLQYNMNRFQLSYSPELTNLLEFMLARDERARPDWAELEQHVIKVEQDANGANQVQNKQPQGFMDKIFATIKETAKLNPFSSQSKSNIFDKKPLSTSKIESARSSHNYLQPSSPPKSQILLKPSDITETRPLRNIFPESSYTTLTKIDENILVVEQQRNSFNQQSSPQLEDHSKNIAEFTLQGQNTSGQAEYVRQDYPQGSRFEGYKLHGVKHGFGKFYYQDGGKYEGQWVWGHMEGPGQLYYQSNKLAYQGQWKNDQFCGKGTLYNEDPEPLRGPYDFRNFNKIQEHWTKYQGFFQDDMKHGKGALYLSNGEFYEGQFRYDFVQGIGSFTTITGERIRGMWVHNLME